MNRRLTRRLGIAATAALSIAALPSILGSAGADAPVAVPAGTTVEREITIDLPAVAPAEVVLLVDSTGSEYESLGPAIDRIVSAAESAGAPLRIAVANVGDYPVRPFGVAGDAPYALLQPLSDDPATWSGVLDGLETRRVGGDPAEGQIGALAEAIQDGDVGFTRDATKLAIVVSDARAHDGDDVGCDDNGTCVDYPGPMAVDVADLAATGGIRLASLGVAHDDALRLIAPPIGAVHDGRDPLVDLFLPELLSVSPVTTCDGDVTVTYEPGTVTGLPGATASVRQRITSGPDVEGAITCNGSPVGGLDLVVDTSVATITEIDTLTDPTLEPAPPADAPEDPAIDLAEEGDPAETETADDPDPQRLDDETIDVVDPVVASLALSIEPTSFLLDISLASQTQETLLADGAVITESSGTLPQTGFDAALVAELTEEPLGGVVVPDPEQPLVWQYQPAGPGTDMLEYTLTDADGVLVATITVEFEITEPAADEAEESEPQEGDGAEESEPQEGDGAEEPAAEAEDDARADDEAPPPADEVVEEQPPADPVNEDPAEPPGEEGEPDGAAPEPADQPDPGEPTEVTPESSDVATSEADTGG